MWKARSCRRVTKVGLRGVDGKKKMYTMQEGSWKATAKITSVEAIKVRNIDRLDGKRPQRDRKELTLELGLIGVGRYG